MRVSQPEARSRRSGLLILFIVLSIVLITLWFREGSTGPVHRLRTAIQTVAAPVQSAGEFVTRPARKTFAWIADLGVSRSQLQTLETQNQELRNRVATLEEAALENQRLTSLLGFVQTNGLKTLGARVIGQPTDYSRVITIDRGSADGVTVAMPVVGAAGVVGQTIEVTAHTAQVRLITDADSGVAALIQTNRAAGIVRGSVEGVLELDFVGRDTVVKVGDLVVTSGIGGIYPKGLLIGEVTKIENLPSNLYQTIRLAPAGDFSKLEEVLVLLGTASSTQAAGGK